MAKRTKSQQEAWELGHKISSQLPDPTTTPAEKACQVELTHEEACRLLCYLNHRTSLIDGLTYLLEQSGRASLYIAALWRARGEIACGTVKFVGGMDGGAQGVVTFTHDEFVRRIQTCQTDLKIIDPPNA